MSSEEELTVIQETEAVDGAGPEEAYEMEVVDMAAGSLKAAKGAGEAINGLLKDMLGKGLVDAVLVPYRVPAGDSYTYLLIKDPALVDDAEPMAPIMTTQGGRALSMVTKCGTSGLRVAAVMRPCEVRAAVELSKLAQSRFDDVTMISFDCPGVLSTKYFNEDPEKAVKVFAKGMDDKSADGAFRPLCGICDNSSSAFGDIHVAALGVGDKSVLLVQRTKRGADLLAGLGISTGEALDGWQGAVSGLVEDRRKKRAEAVEQVKAERLGLANLLDTFSTCVKCHNCMRACPVDYCQQCYFECDDLKYTAGDYLARTANAGSMRFPPDSLQYHLGRMLHMAMSCVSCGTCEDACPAHIPVAQVYSAVADDVQGTFEYLSGRDPKEPRPLATFKENEFTDMEY